MENTISILLGVAVLLPLGAFFVNLLAGHALRKKNLSRVAAWTSMGAIVTSTVLSFISLAVWLQGENPSGKSNIQVLAELKESNEEHLQHLNVDHEGHVEHGAAEHDVNEGHDEADHDHDSTALNLTASHNRELLVAHENSAEASHETGVTEKSHAHHADGSHHGPQFEPLSGVYYTLGKFGSLALTIGYYIDSLTLAMFCMVTLISSLIHLYAYKYMDDELPSSKRGAAVDCTKNRFLAFFYRFGAGSHDDHDSHDDEHAAADDPEDDFMFVDHEVSMEDGSHCHRTGRYPRFFQALSLFCFSMLGLVLAGNVAMTFVFWELVGICSYFLIGFYVERKSASTAANKAFIVNRVGDFGMIIGLMIFWTGFGTFNYGDDGDESGLFSQMEAATVHHVEAHDGVDSSSVPAVVPAKLVSAFYEQEIKDHRIEHGVSAEQAIAELQHERVENGESPLGYWLMIIGGLGIFCGCIGKSAQFPLHVWLPDAMEGPTPVSALVHSATMVAAGVLLVGRFYPMFVPETLLVIAIIGTITLFIGATIAITANDIKKVLAYSTISQLGYMIMALGAGGWVAGLLHLFTHAFFKSLLFMGSGSVIHAVHTNDMREMGGLRKKIPVTAYTMFVACLAIAGAGIPFVIGTSGYYSKDSILEQAFSWGQQNGFAFGGIFFWVATASAAITAFYMFRMWFMTFAGKPRNEERYAHAHEYPNMVYPLVILAVFAIAVAWPNPLQKGFDLSTLLEASRPATISGTSLNGSVAAIVVPDEHLSHMDTIKTPVTLLATVTGIIGILLATFMYVLPGSRGLVAAEMAAKFKWIHNFLLNKWWFDELYEVIFVKPSQVIGRWISWVDQNILDSIVHFCARATKAVARFWERLADQIIVDGSVNLMARWIYQAGVSLRRVQTGSLRQYVLFIVIAAITVFVLVSFMWEPVSIAEH
jgi:NADH:ubiquinone oxidoreductase subunit 5 (subunit L)/multisubunit Na+/H+ antiporter MnhA subunit